MSNVKFLIQDNTATNGRYFIGDDFKNYSDPSNAAHFDSEEEAIQWLNMMCEEQGIDSEWASIQIDFS